MHAYRRAHSVREGAGEPFRLCMLCQFLCCGLHDCAIRPVDALICIKPPETGVVQMAGEAVAHFGVGLEEIGLEDSDGNRGFSWEKNYPGDEGVSAPGVPASFAVVPKSNDSDSDQPALVMTSNYIQHERNRSSEAPPHHSHMRGPQARQDPGTAQEMSAGRRQAAIRSGPKAGGASGNAPVTSVAQHYGRGSPRGAVMRRSIPDDDISSGTDTDEDGALIEKARQAAEQKRAPPKKRGPTTGRPRPGGGITLKLLIDEGILVPGENVLTVEYKSNITYGSLAECGRIKCRIAGTELTFESPSAFSIYLKRLINPARKADDGWKTVKFEGKFLEHYKLELARRRFGPTTGVASRAAFGSMDEPPSKKPRIELDQAYSGNSMSASPRAPRQPSKPKAPRVPVHQPYREPAPAEPLEPHASGRPRRNVKTPGYRLGSNVEDEHQMVEPEQYRGTAGSGAQGAQPFRVEVTPAAQVVMDFHAHLNMNEVIGLLAGICDEEQRLIRVLRAFPVRELVTEDDTINAEMDPEDVFKVTETIQEHHNLRVVGWYHSHPTFATFPSMIDIANQVTQQNAHKTASCEPYIAAIVGPYNKKLTTCQSSMTWFYVQHEAGRIPSEDENPLQAGCTPMELQVAVVHNAELDAPLLGQSPRGAADSPMMQDLEDLAQQYASQRTRAELAQAWRPGLNKLDKMMMSLDAWMSHCPVKLRRQFLQKLQPLVQAAWEVYGPPVDWEAAAMQLQNGKVHKNREEDEPEISDATDGLHDGDGMAHLNHSAAGPSGTGFIRNNGVALLKQDETGSVSAGASAGVSDDQYADSGMHANGGYHQTSRFGRSAPLLHERMQSTNSSTPIHREYDGGVDEEQSLTSDTQ